MPWFTFKTFLQENRFLKVQLVWRYFHALCNLVFLLKLANWIPLLLKIADWNYTDSLVLYYNISCRIHSRVLLFFPFKEPLQTHCTFSPIRGANPEKSKYYSPLRHNSTWVLRPFWYNKWKYSEIKIQFTSGHNTESTVIFVLLKELHLCLALMITTVQTSPALDHIFKWCSQSQM